MQEDVSGLPIFHVYSKFKVDEKLDLAVLVQLTVSSKEGKKLHN